MPARLCFGAAGLDVKDIRELREMAVRVCGPQRELRRGERVVAEVLGHLGEHVDYIYSLPEEEGV